ncbi:MAG: Maf-like protein YhdE [Myxococcota bacterium]|nr:Maf-like protein YhdE [Myxococcota bacterium]
MGFILASASPRRIELLRHAGMQPRVIPAAHEVSPEAEEPPRAYALRAASGKGWQVAERHPGDWVLAADTIVTLDEAILGKPRDRDHAAVMLSSLAGRWHQVITAVCLIHSGDGQELSTAVISSVMFRQSSPEDLRRYVDSGEPMDKAGAYAIQGAGSFLVREVRGSYTNIIGLPVEETLGLLRLAGIGAA